MKKADEILEDCSALYKERHKVYGDNYKLHGKIMSTLFPDGIVLKTIGDHNRFGIFTQMICKMTRYAENFTKGGHEDSLLDNSTYSAMLAELDQQSEQKENND